MSSHSNTYTIIQSLHQSKQSTIARALRQYSEPAPQQHDQRSSNTTSNNNNNKTFILKTYNLSRRRNERLYREYTIGSLFKDSPHVVQYIGLEECFVQRMDMNSSSVTELLLLQQQQQQQYDEEQRQQQLYIIMEDDGGVNLSSLIPRYGFDIGTFLHIAIQMVHGVGEMHNHGVINRDIKPDNVIINMETKAIKFIDFGSATMRSISDESGDDTSSIDQGGINKDILQGTLTYISPEQTGRLNAPIDFRTDFYSLGITFYQMLSGSVPFKSKNVIKLLHSHIAKEPVPLHEFVKTKTIPLPLSQIVSKLLQKNVDLRYQSAHGLLYDLKYCLDQLTKKGIIEPFTIAERDVGEKFVIPSKLYGRDKEIKHMREAFDHVCSGSPELLIVSGRSGVGKTSLIAELQSVVVERRGYFISGKFDQLTKGAYSTLRQVFDALLKHLMREENVKAYWKSKIEEQLGVNAQVVLDVLPSLESLIGKQPPAPALGVVEAQNRFDLVFEGFLSCLARQEHPIVWFFDDLQWADAPSLHILEILMRSSKTRNMLLIVSYRENEVSESHIANIAIDEMKKTVMFSQISLESLSFEVTHQWITDILHDRMDNTRDLVTAIYQKTNGNPFFVKMFMQSLYDERLIFHCWDHWEWDLEKIQVHPSTENVIELMIHRISLLPSTSRRLLQLASCIGNHFDIHTLALLEGSTSDILMRKLSPVFDGGLGYCRGDIFYFGHDRIQEAAYSGLSENEKKEIHLKLGFILLKHAPEMIEEIDNIFDIVGHLNKGLDILLTTASSEDIVKVLKLNHSASSRAKDAIAYTSALTYGSYALKYLHALGDEDEIWTNYHSESFSLHKLLFQIYNLCKMDTEAGNTIQVLLQRAASKREKGEVYYMQITELTVRTLFSEAIAIGRIALKNMGLDFPVDASECSVVEAKENAKLKIYLNGDISKHLGTLPEMTDKHMLVVFKLLNSLLVSTFASDRPLYSASLIAAVRISLEYGRNPSTALAFCFYGGYLCSIGDSASMRLGYLFTKSSLSLCDKYNTPALKSQVLHIASNLVYPWSQPLSTIERYCNAAYKCGLEGGEMQYAGYSRFCAVMTSFQRGDSLEDVLAKANRYIGFVKGVGNVLSLAVIESYKLASLKMMGDRCPKNELAFLQKEASVVESCKKVGDYALFHWTILEMIRVFIYHPRELNELYNKLKEVEALLVFADSHYYLVTYRFYSSLLYIKMIEDLQSDTGVLTKGEYDVQILLQKVSDNRAILKNMINNCPQNFKHKYLLVEAERRRIEGSCNDFELMGIYDSAIEEATKYGFMVESALANELAYQFWLTKKNKEHIAKGYLDVACITYSKWGATQKAFNLKISSPNAVKAYNLPLSTSIHNTNTVSVIGAMVDLDMIIKASQVISSTIDMDKLLFNILKMLIEYSGAQKGCIILDGRVEAEYKPKSSHEDFNSERIETLHSIPIEEWEDGCYEIIDNVRHTNETVVICNACQDRNYEFNEYINKNGIKSVMCMPVTQQANATLLYLENNLISGAFTEQRIRVLSVLTSQMAISLENAKYFKAQMNAAEQIAEMQRARALEAEYYRRKQDELTDRICHEIRNPLNGVFGNLELLKSNATLLRTMTRSVPAIADRYPLDSILDNILERIESINMCAKHQQVITDDVLTLSTLDVDQIPLNICPFSPNEIIVSTVKMFEAAITKKNLRMDIEYLKEDIRLLSDPHRITQALLNLVSNSVKFTQYGSITLKVQLIPIPDTNKEVFLQYSIQDTGVGMSEKEQRSIFNPFKQGNSKISSEYGGSGIGLFITKTLVQLLNGEMFVESEKNVGSTFTFNIRCSKATPTVFSVHDPTTSHSQKSTKEQKQLSPPNQSLNILVAEDNIINQKILIRMLQQAGYNHFVANNGEEAIILNEKEDIDVILMDIEMPVMSGLEATQRIREKERSEKHQRVAIIGISGNARKEHVDKALEVGMDDYLIKPVNKQNVLRKIAEHTRK